MSDLHDCRPRCHIKDPPTKGVAYTRKGLKLDTLAFHQPVRAGQLADKIVHRQKLLNILKGHPPIYASSKGSPLQKVLEFPYLGSIISYDGSDWPELESRIRKMWVAYSHVRRFLTDKTLAGSLRLRLLRCYVFSVLLYGSETWHLSSRQVASALIPLEHKLQRAMDLPKHLAIGLVAQYTRRRLGFLGHMLRLPNGRAEREALWLPETRHAYESDLQGRSLEKAAEDAKDRVKWRSFVNIIASHL